MGFIAILLSVATFILAIAKNFSQQMNEDDRLARRRRQEVVDDSQSDRSRGSLPPGVLPKPHLTAQQFKQQGDHYTRQQLDALVNSKQYKDHKDGLRFRGIRDSSEGNLSFGGPRERDPNRSALTNQGLVTGRAGPLGQSVEQPECVAGLNS